MGKRTAPELPDLDTLKARVDELADRAMTALARIEALLAQRAENEARILAVTEATGAAPAGKGVDR